MRLIYVQMLHQRQRVTQVDLPEEIKIEQLRLVQIRQDRRKSKTFPSISTKAENAGKTW